MSPNIVRYIWQIVVERTDSAPSSVNASADLAKQIVAMVDASFRLSAEERDSVHQYVLDRVPLMHDLSMQG